jgi:hypothetical protein
MAKDNRIIDLDLDNPVLPDFFDDLEQPINMTMCAGDGVHGEITDIEWFVTKKVGHDREKKPTTIFITTKNYTPHLLEQNKQYLRSHPELQVILLVYDDKNPKWKENLVRLFPTLINNIYEDRSCYGDKLDLETLYKILREGGIYQMEHYLPKINNFMRELHSYKDYWKFFNINLANIPYEIIKNDENVLILPSTWQAQKENFRDKDEQLMFDNTNANGLERFKLDVLDDERRTKAKAKLSNCETDADCKFFGKNGVCNLQEKKCHFDSKGGDKKTKIKTKIKTKTKKSRKNKKSKTRRKAKKTRKYCSV